MRRPKFTLLCPDCHYPIWLHHRQGVGRTGRARHMSYLWNPTTRIRCRAVIEHDPLAGPRIVALIPDRKKNVPRGKRRDRRGQGKPR